MATLQDIMAMLRNMRDTRAETGRVGMEAMKYQGDKYKQIGDRLNNMVGTWVGRAEAKKERDMKERLAGEEWTTKKSIADREAADRLKAYEAEAERHKELYGPEGFYERQNREEASLRKSLADKQNQGGGKEKPTSDYPASLMKLAFSIDGGFDPVNEGLNWETVKKDPQKAISTYEALMRIAVMEGMDKNLAEEYKALFRSELNQYIKGAGGPGPDTDITEDTGRVPLMDRFTKAPEGRFADVVGEGGAVWRYPNPAYKADIPEPEKFAAWEAAGRPESPGRRRSGVEFTADDIKNFFLFLRATGRK